MTYRNHEGYSDPTAGKAIRNLEKKRKFKRRDFIHARWLNLEADPDGQDVSMMCSNCHSVEIPLARHRYCPNCGARMDKEN